MTPIPDALRYAVAVLLGRRPPANPSRDHLEAFVRRAAATVEAPARVLDAGAGDGRYGRWFGHVTYESADFCRLDKPYGHLTYICDLAHVPAEDGRFDLVLLTQVLEHLPDPLGVLRELRRLLKRGGRLWLTCPLYYPEHEQPFDYYRYTQFGLRHLLTEAGFQIEEVTWLEGFAGTASFQLGQLGRQLPVSPSAYGGGPSGLGTAVAVWASRPLLRSLALLLARADRGYRHVSSGHCKNYQVVARA
jgi:SAM-dependent methyltransferase